MGEESFLKPVDSARAFTISVDKVKTEPAKAGTAPAKAKPEPTPKPDAQEHEVVENTAWQTSSAVKELIAVLAGQRSEVSITKDSETRQIIVKVLDSTTGEVIRRMPLKDPVHKDDTLWKLTGLLLDTRE
jgi:flagellar protein FlaG